MWSLCYFVANGATTPSTAPLLLVDAAYIFCFAVATTSAASVTAGWLLLQKCLLILSCAVAVAIASIAIAAVGWLLHFILLFPIPHCIALCSKSTCIMPHFVVCHVAKLHCAPLPCLHCTPLQFVALIVHPAKPRHQEFYQATIEKVGQQLKFLGHGPISMATTITSS